MLLEQSYNFSTMKSLATFRFVLICCKIDLKCQFHQHFTLNFFTDIIYRGFSVFLVKITRQLVKTDDSYPSTSTYWLVIDQKRVVMLSFFCSIWVVIGRIVIEEVCYRATFGAVLPMDHWTVIFALLYLIIKL